MNTQTELFPKTKHIPDWLADYFYKANAGKYPGKQDFYMNVKPHILSHGEFAGYDLQIINKPCHSCDGTGVYKKYDWNGRVYNKETCWSCGGTGIYMTKKMSLKRFILNGSLYHVPAYEFRAEPHKNIIQGYITHDFIHEDEARRAYLILLWKYNRNWFYARINEWINASIGSAKNELREFIQVLIRKENTNDELPF